MAFDIWLTFFATAAVVIVTPGPSTLLVLAHGLSYGRRPAFATIAGSWGTTSRSNLASARPVESPLRPAFTTGRGRVFANRLGKSSPRLMRYP